MKASACFVMVFFKSLSIGFDKNTWQIHLSCTSIVPPDWIASYHHTTDIISLSSFSSETGVVLLRESHSYTGDVRFLCFLLPFDRACESLVFKLNNDRRGNCPKPDHYNKKAYLRVLL